MSVALRWGALRWRTTHGGWSRAGGKADGRKAEPDGPEGRWDGPMRQGLVGREDTPEKQKQSQWKLAALVRGHLECFLGL